MKHTASKTKKSSGVAVPKSRAGVRVEPPIIEDKTSVTLKALAVRFAAIDAATAVKIKRKVNYAD